MKLEYIGILDNVNYKELSENEILDLLVKKGIYISAYKYLSNSIEEHNHTIIDFQPKYCSGQYLYILNPKISEEIYFELFNQIEIDDYSEEVEEYSAYLNSEIENLITKKDQKKFLKKEHEKMIDFLKKEPSAPLYLGRDTTYMDCESWEELVRLWSKSPRLMKPYLEEYDFDVHDLCFYNEFINTWIKLCEIKHLRPVVEKLLRNFEEVPTFSKSFSMKTIENSAAYLIFTENGLEVFNLLNTLFTGKKNTAFYSYLYLFLRDNKLLFGPLKNDHQNYREYIINNTKLESFKRIQITSSIKQKEKDEIFSFFKRYYEEYCSIKNE